MEGKSESTFFKDDGEPYDNRNAYCTFSFH